MTTRAAIFAAIKAARGRGFSATEVEQVDAILDGLDVPRDAAAPLGKLSEQYESGGRGPATVSSGTGDPGGVSYGLYQLASRVGTLAQFLASDGARWHDELLRGGAMGTPGFSAAWKAIAAREPDAFAAAQHAFIERTHYRPTVAGVLAKTGLDLDSRSQAVRDATWSTAVQHGGAVRILCDAIGASPGAAAVGDRALLQAIYKRRADYVRGVAAGYTGTVRNTLLSVVENRYPAELKAALAMLA